AFNLVHDPVPVPGGFHRHWGAGVAALEKVPQGTPLMGDLQLADQLAIPSVPPTRVCSACAHRTLYSASCEASSLRAPFLPAGYAPAREARAFIPSIWSMAGPLLLGH